MDDDDKDQLVSADGDSDGMGDEKTVDPDLLDELDDAALEDDLEEEVVDPIAEEDDDEDDEGYGLDTDDQ
jgi:hypothetical protein